MTAWALYAIATGLLLGAAAWSLERGAGAVGLPTRWIWLGAMMASVAIPAWAALQTPAPPPVGWTTERIEFGPLAPLVGDLGQESVPASTLRDLPGLAAERLGSSIQAAAGKLPSGPGATGWALALWIAGSLAGTLLVVGSALTYARRARRWPGARLHGRQVRIAPDLGPAVVGILRPEIVVPRWTLALHDRELDLVLDHESEHVRARDPLLLGVATALALAMPWHPGLWWQLQRLRQAVELDCDRRVLRDGALRRQYGELLLRLGRRRPGLLGVPALTGTPSLLERRLRAMRTHNVRRAALPAALTTALAIVLVVVACETDAPTSAPDASETVPPEAAEAAVTEDEAGMPAAASAVRTRRDGGEAASAGAPLWIVDGNPVTVPDNARDGLSRPTAALRAAGIDPEEVHSYSVLRGTAATGLYGARARHGAIVVTTEAGASAEEVAERAGEADEGAAADLTDASGEAEAGVLREQARAAGALRGSDEQRSGVDVEGMVVTALGISRDRSGEDVDRTREMAVTATESDVSVESEGTRLTGERVSVRGAAGRVVIRGESSYAGGGQPLWVIDGVPVEMDADGGGGSGTRSMDLDMNTIEEMSVLRGAAATSMYGDAAEHGAIIITTRDGETGGDGG